MKTLLLTALLSIFSLVVLADDKTQLPTFDQVAPPDLPNAYRILFVGDSITSHGKLPAIKWDHTSGMAASTLENDYVHKLGALIQAAMPDKAVQLMFPKYAVNGAAAVQQFGGGTAGEKAAIMHASQAYRPNLVIIQLGEHERQTDGQDVIAQNYEKLLSSFDDWTPKPVVLCTGVWDPQTAAPGSTDLQYTGWPPNLDKTIQAMCEKHHVPFVSVESLAMDPTCKGYGEDGGVQWHPNDKAHAGYADRLFAAFQTVTKPN